MTKKTINILFVGGAKRYSVAEKLISAGQEMQIDIKIFSYEMGEGLPISDIATVIPGLRFDDPFVLDDLRQKINEYEIQIALPFHDLAVPILSRLNGEVFVPTCNENLCSIFSSKIQSVEFFKRNCIPLPPSSGAVPAIAKPDFGSASKGLLKFADQIELDIFLKSEASKNYCIQDLVSGPEFSVDGYIAVNGDFRHFAVRERLEVLGGEAVRSRTISIPEIEACCNKISHINGVKGAITLQFIYDQRTQMYGIMEINPRFGGGMLTSWGAGVPWFHILLNDYLGLQQQTVSHRNGVLMVRSFREHFFG